MPETTYLFFDYETFGLNYRRDRPAQFAAVRTDTNFRPVEDPVVIYAKPHLDCLPDPRAVAVTGILPQDCWEKGLPEPVFAAKIHEMLSRPGTVRMGYNSAGFDDHVSRFLFWRNFLDAYAPEKNEGCGRHDVFKLAVAAYALRPEGIVWPKKDSGRPSFRLEELTKANGLVHEHAHDALSDVEATVALASLIREKAPRLYEYAMRIAPKKAVVQLVESGKPLAWVDVSFGPEAGYAQLVAPVCPHPANANGVVVFNLRHDPAELLSLTPETLEEAMRSDSAPAMLKTLRINQLPFLTTALHGLHEGHAGTLGVSPEVARERYEALKTVAPQVAGVLSLGLADKSEASSAPKEERLYEDAFPSFADRNAFARIRSESPESLASLAASGREIFEDDGFEELLFRYRARNFPDSLADAEKARWKEICRSRLLDGAEGAMTLAAYQEAIDAYAEEAGEDERAQAICGALYDWGDFVSESLD